MSIVKLRVLYLADAGAPHTRRWAHWFAARGHEVHVATLNDATLDDYGQAHVHIVWHQVHRNSLAVRVAKAPVVLRRLRTLVQRVRPHIVHAHSAGGYAWLATVLGVRPYVVTPWGTDLLVDAKKSTLNRLATTVALRRAELVTTDAFHFVETLKEFGVDETNVLVHMFGVNVSHFSPGPAPLERQALGAHNAPVVISTRTPNPVHDVGTFIRAIPLVLEEHPNARFIVVGDGAERSSLETLTEQLGVSEQTQFVGMVDENRMQRLLRASDVYVSTSLMDAGIAGSTAEAMATGLPVVHTRNSDNERWAPHGVGGLLFDNRDHAGAARHVNALLRDPSLRARMGQRNRQTIVEDCNMDTEMSRVEAAYKRISSIT